MTRRWPTLLLLAALGVLAAYLYARDAPNTSPEPRGGLTLDNTDDKRVYASLALLAAAARGQVEPHQPPIDPAYRDDVVAAGRELLRGPLGGFRDDCSGYVSAVFSTVDVPMDGFVASIWDQAVDHDTLHWQTRPEPGDVAFFDDTHDRNGNGAIDDPLTHIALVLDVEADGTVLLAHGGTKRGRTTTRMNLEHPSIHKDASGRVLNAWLREIEPGDTPQTRYLTGELWVAWATIDPELDWQTHVPVIDG